MKILERLNPNNTISINRPIAHALGLGAAVVYSALISKYEYYYKHNMLDEEGFFYSTIADLQESTSMGKCQQSNAIKVLTDAGLVEVCRRGMPAKRYFRVRDEVELLDKFLKHGKEIIAELNPIAQLDDNRQTCCTETEQQVGGFSDNKLAQNEPYTINPNIIKSKENNPNQSIHGVADMIDMMDNSTEIVSADKRSDYLELIRENIEYDCFDKREQEKVDELIQIMLDVVCSSQSTVRVHGEDLPHDVVKSRFLKLNHEHIEYVLLSLKRNTSDVKNIRAYLITTLYNAPTTIDSYYTALVNHDMYGSA
ncbi:MAG: DUF6017 domain-containing protein [Oscillospiraceae bacterium]|nr:DUF6017 domain-containing protein [Oscillospiraceae bacterium]